MTRTRFAGQTHVKAKGKAAAAVPEAAPSPASQAQAAEVLSNWQQQAAALCNSGAPQSQPVLSRMGDLLLQQHQVCPAEQHLAYKHTPQTLKCPTSA